MVRKSPMIVAGLLFALMLERVANFISSIMQVGGWTYSIAIALGVLVCAYFSRAQFVRSNADRITARWVTGLAVSGMIVLAVLDGYFNLLETLRHAKPSSFAEEVAVFVFGLAPTILAAFLGTLQGWIDKLPIEDRAVSRRKNLINRIIERWLAGIASKLPDAKILDEPPAVEKPKTEFECPYCDYVAESSPKLRGHIGGAHGRKKKEAAQ